MLINSLYGLFLAAVHAVGTPLHSQKLNKGFQTTYRWLALLINTFTIFEAGTDLKLNTLLRSVHMEGEAVLYSVEIIGET